MSRAWRGAGRWTVRASGFREYGYPHLITAPAAGHPPDMREEDELFEEAHRSREETEELREESGLGSDDGEPPNEDRPKPREGEPWAKTSSGDAENVAQDD
jgi:hypothetical protein